MAARESAAVQAAVAAHNRGMSMVAAAKKYGVNRSSIQRAMLRRGKPPGRQQPEPAEA
jgi:DNA-binding phage protein